MSFLITIGLDICPNNKQFITFNANAKTECIWLYIFPTKLTFTTCITCGRVIGNCVSTKVL